MARTQGYTQGYYDLRDAFRQEGCPVCRLTLAGVARYVGAINYESAADPGVRERLRASLGFCNAHAHQWLGAAHVLGTAQLYADLLARLAEELRALPVRRRGRLASVASRLTPRAESSGTRRRTRRSRRSSGASPSRRSRRPTPLRPGSASPTCASPSAAPRTRGRSTRCARRRSRARSGCWASSGRSSASTTTASAASRRARRRVPASGPCTTSSAPPASDASGT